MVIRHGDDPPDDRVHTWLVGAGFAPDVRRPFAGEALGDLDDSVAGLVVHGGRYNADAVGEHPFLKDEYRWIEAALAAGLPMLGICQGAQMIAHHLGASVGPKPGEPAEFGYYRIDPTPEGTGFLPGPLWVTQAHFHAFSIPGTATRLAESALFENQAYRYGAAVYGVQFHPEVTIEGFRRWQRDFAGFEGKPGIQEPAEQTRLMLEHDAAQAAWFYDFMANLFGSAASAGADGPRDGSRGAREDQEELHEAAG